MNDEDKSKDQLLRELAELRNQNSELKAQELRYMKLLHAVTDYIYMVQVEDGRPVKTIHGPACISVTGYTTEDYDNDPFLWIKMVYEEDRDLVRAQANTVLSGADVQPLEHRIIHKDGSLRWVRNTPVPRYEGNRLVAYDGLIADITERKEAEALLRRLSKTDGLTGLANLCIAFQQ